MFKRAQNAEEVKKRKTARLRFRNLIRSVALNRIWLADADEGKFSLNVKKNISMLVRTQRKIGILTMAEKSLIRTHYQLRTIEDRKKLLLLVTGLNCFNKIPPKVRARLSQCVNFMVVNPGRILIKEGGSPMMVYFLLTGEVEVSKQIYDHIQNIWVNRIKAINGPGDCLGDVEMIERCARRHTYTSINVVELLVVFEEDFERILRPVMEQQWKDKKNAIMSLDYFKFLTEDQIINACKLCVLRQFEPLETIYYEDKGQLSYVHFVISGECMILQCLKMVVNQKKGVKHFQLIDTTKKGISSVFQDLTDMQLLRNLRTNEDNLAYKNVYNIDELILSAENINRPTTKTLDNKYVDIKGIEIKCGLVEANNNGTEKFKFSAINSKLNLNSAAVKENKLKNGKTFQQIPEGLKEINLAKKEANNSKLENNIHVEDIDDKNSQPVEQNANNGRKNLNLEEKSIFFQSKTGQKHSTLKSLRNSIKYKTPAGKFENHFIDVGSLTFGSIFGLGEKLKDRVIMARTTVQCLMIPRFWLLEKNQNPGNIWQRRRFYLDSTIPSRQILFNDFLNTRQWQKFKKNLIQIHLNPYSISNPTRVQDIPIICRIVEGSDE